MKLGKISKMTKKAVLRAVGVLQKRGRREMSPELYSELFAKFAITARNVGACAANNGTERTVDLQSCRQNVIYYYVCLFRISTKEHYVTNM